MIGKEGDMKNYLINNTPDGYIPDKYPGHFQAAPNMSSLMEKLAVDPRYSLVTPLTSRWYESTIKSTYTELIGKTGHLYDAVDDDTPLYDSLREDKDKEPLYTEIINPDGSKSSRGSFVLPGNPNILERHNAFNNTPLLGSNSGHSNFTPIQPKLNNNFSTAPSGPSGPTPLSSHFSTNPSNVRYLFFFLYIPINYLLFSAYIHTYIH